MARKAPLREVQRANVLLYYADEVPILKIQQLVSVSRPSIYKCIDKALAAGAEAGLKDYCKSRPGRFGYVHTPKLGSWLNLIETAFSKMVRTFLRHIRVSSKEELKEHILKDFSEINATPVV